jgi:hypothetical protein
VIDDGKRQTKDKRLLTADCLIDFNLQS